MAWKKVVRYWLGYNADIKQCYVYYSIEGNPAILPLTVTPRKCSRSPTCLETKAP